MLLDLAPGIAGEIKALRQKLTDSRSTLEELQDRNQDLERMIATMENKSAGLATKPKNLPSFA